MQVAPPYLLLSLLLLSKPVRLHLGRQPFLLLLILHQHMRQPGVLVHVQGSGGGLGGGGLGDGSLSGKLLSSLCGRIACRGGDAAVGGKHLIAYEQR